MRSPSRTRQASTDLATVDAMSLRNDSNSSGAVGARLVAALVRCAAAASLTPDELKQALAGYP